MYLKSDFTLRVYIVIFCEVFVLFFFCLVAVLGSFLEPPHAVVPIISPFDHNRSLREYQSVASFAVVLPAENQVKPSGFDLGTLALQVAFMHPHRGRSPAKSRPRVALVH